MKVFYCKRCGRQFYPPAGCDHCLKADQAQAVADWNAACDPTTKKERSDG